MKTPTLFATAALAALTLGAGAQSADNFESTRSAAEAAQQAADVQMEVIDKEAESELLASPSRYAGLDLEKYVQALSSSFSMRKRDLDPFALHQDPNFKPVQRVIAKKNVPKFKKEPVTPFSDIVARINVTAVVPAKQTFLVGERNFSVGDRIRLDVGKDKPISVHVVSIQATSVTFRHGITGETASLSLKLMPDGMSRGKAEHPPGMVVDGTDAPIDARPGNSMSSRR